MKPINAIEIRNSYMKFILSFLFLTIFSIFCIFLFFAASDYEYALLDKKVKETEKLSYLRKDINTNFDLILVRFKELAQYREYNANEMSKQAILLGDIQTANNRIKDLISRKSEQSPSFDLYGKLNNNVGAMADLQDSLIQSRGDIQRYKEQINECQLANKSAANKIRNGRYGR
ncbi:type VI secretion system TssO [Pedobacter sp. R20-19]|uniref:type VI secretion system TssO n=1 Tax=Pedobacter sp. R20-19 TaxID=1270196 RepID=UPI000493225A|nr:type VI secretion system TssO [Pedobacter sp. R20-19]